MSAKLITLRVPKRYADCSPSGFNSARPCPYQCKHVLPTGDCTLDLAGGKPMTVPQIAEALGESEEAIEKVLARALEKLKANKMLREFYEA